MFRHRKSLIIRSAVNCSPIYRLYRYQSVYTYIEWCFMSIFGYFVIVIFALKRLTKWFGIDLNNRQASITCFSDQRYQLPVLPIIRSAAKICRWAPGFSLSSAKYLGLTDIHLYITLVLLYYMTRTSPINYFWKLHHNCNNDFLETWDRTIAYVAFKISQTTHNNGGTASAWLWALAAIGYDWCQAFFWWQQRLMNN